MASERKIVPYRNSSTLPAEYIRNTLINDGINLAGRKGIMPNGEVIYHGNEAEYKYMEYVQEVVDSTGIPYTIIVPYKFEVIVDMKEDNQTITNNHSVVA